MKLIIFGFILLGVVCGVIVSADITYESEQKNYVMPEDDFLKINELFAGATKNVLGGYSVESLLEYMKPTNPKARSNYQLVLESYSEKFGSLKNCQDSDFVYFKEYQLIHKNEYYWQWKSLCEFSKRKGYVTIKFSKSGSNWLINKYGIEEL